MPVDSTATTGRLVGPSADISNWWASRAALVVADLSRELAHVTRSDSSWPGILEMGERYVARVRQLQNVPVGQVPNEPLLYWVPSRAQRLCERAPGVWEYRLLGGISRGASVIIEDSEQSDITVEMPMRPLREDWWSALTVPERRQMVLEIGLGEADISNIVNSSRWVKREIGRNLDVRKDWWWVRSGHEEMVSRIHICAPVRITSLIRRAWTRWHTLLLPQIAGVRAIRPLNGAEHSRCYGAAAFLDIGAPLVQLYQDSGFCKGSTAWMIDVSWQNWSNTDLVTNNDPDWGVELEEIVDEYCEHLEAGFSPAPGTAGDAGAQDTCRAWSCLGLWSSGTRTQYWIPRATKIETNRAWYSWAREGQVGTKLMRLGVTARRSAITSWGRVAAAVVASIPVFARRTRFNIPSGAGDYLILVPKRYIARARKALQLDGAAARTNAFLEICAAWSKTLESRIDTNRRVTDE